MNLSCVMEEKASFQILAVSREFHEKECFQEIPKFWKEYYAKGNGGIACGQYGVCYGGDGTGKFRYAIGNECRMETHADGSTVYHIFNCPDRTEIPDAFELLTVPAATWAAFECLGPLPHSIQDMWPRIYKEWLPASGYEKLPGFDLEEYGCCKCPEDSQRPDYRCVIRIPVRAIEQSACTIRPMSDADIIAFPAAFSTQNWTKGQSQFERYFAERLSGKRQVFVAEVNGEVAGYATLLPEAETGPFKDRGIPEIADFNVLGYVVNRCVLYYANVKKEAKEYGECVRAARYIG